MAVSILLRFQKERSAAIVRAVIQRTPGAGAGAVTPARRPHSRPADMFGARGSLMGFITTMMAAGRSADHVPTCLHGPFGLARKDSRDDAFGGIAGTVPGNSFDV
jgi:hypothetical protein